MRGNGTNGTSLEAKSLSELEALKRDVDVAVAAKRAEAEKTIREMTSLAQARGFDAKELLLGGSKGGRPAKAVAAPTPKKVRKAKAKKPAKYRNPSDHKQTWSGHGKRPAWYVSLTKGGTPASALEISR